jgi:hypothetical protein
MKVEKMDEREDGEKRRKKGEVVKKTREEFRVDFF